MGLLLVAGQSVTPCGPGLAVLTYSATRGWPAVPDEAWAHAISVARQGFVVFATPSFTATMPNAWPDGSVVPHCGYDTSFPVGMPPVCACATAADVPASIKVASTATAVMPDLISQSPLPPPLWPAPDHSRVPAAWGRPGQKGHSSNQLHRPSSSSRMTHRSRYSWLTGSPVSARRSRNPPATGSPPRGRSWRVNSRMDPATGSDSGSAVRSRTPRVPRDPRRCTACPG
jgi:hypothetical protein